MSFTYYSETVVSSVFCDWYFCWQDGQIFESTSEIVYAELKHILWIKSNQITLSTGRKLGFTYRILEYVTIC